MHPQRKPDPGYLANEARHYEAMATASEGLIETLKLARHRATVIVTGLPAGLARSKADACRDWIDNALQELDGEGAVIREGMREDAA